MPTVRKKNGSDVEVSWSDFTVVRNASKPWSVRLMDGSEGYIVWKHELAAEREEAERKAKQDKEDEVSRQMFEEGMREAFPEDDNELPRNVKKLIQEWNNDLS